jgi:4-hydroxy-3-methylbut-2-enyl diphosphate reductase
MLEISKDKNMYILGHIIHNPSVVKDLEKMGAKTVFSVDEIPEPEKAVLIIRSHGVSKKILEYAAQKKIKVVNTTCPFVKKIEIFVEKLLASQYNVVVIGDKNHPEVTSLLDSFKEFDNRIFVVSGFEEVKKLNFGTSKIGVVIQTTQTLKNFKECVYELLEKSMQFKIYNTICQATSKRQNSSIKMAEKVELVLVIGGRISANTTRLYEICKGINSNTYHIENVKEIDESWLKNVNKIGITAGASTPDYIINEIKDYLNKL